MKKLFGILITIAVSHFSFAQTTAKGIVYEDINGNGKKDKREKGIESVAVSNGRDVVLTNKNGMYRIAVDEDDIIFVIKPANYQFPVDSNNLPRFYYIHKPQGSPKNYAYTGVEPTGALPASVDFALISGEMRSDFTGLIFGDPQPYTLKEVEHFTNGIVKELENVKRVAFGLSLGDLVGDNLNLMPPYKHAVKKVGIPWWNVMGNHDMNYEAIADSVSDESFERNFGPANYSFNEGDVHFIILDDILYPDPRDGKGYWGGFTEEQFQFIENDLKLVPKEKLIVLAFHIPLKMHGESYRRSDRDRLFLLLKDFPNTLSLSAHTHLQRHDYFGNEQGWLGANPHHEYNVGTTSGDWYSGELDEQGVPYSTMRDGTRKGYAFIHFSGNKYVIDYKVAGKPSSYQMEIYCPQVISTKRNSYRVYVNFFMGTESDKVEFKIDNQAWKPMRHKIMADPSYMAELMKWDVAETLKPGRRPSNAEPSTHIWEANLPNNLKEGTHILTIKATDMFGRSYEETREFEVVAPL